MTNGSPQHSREATTITGTLNTSNPALDAAVDEAADQILSARDFCGDEREAACDALADSGFAPSADRMTQAFEKANRQWRERQQQAGVGVSQRITDGERRQIERSLSQ